MSHQRHRRSDSVLNCSLMRLKEWKLASGDHGKTEKLIYDLREEALFVSEALEDGLWTFIPM